MHFPTYNNSHKKGEDGITILKKIIEKKLGWIFRKNHLEDDFGIDAYIDIVSEFGQITGKSIAVQIKTGLSFFTEKNAVGWIYRGEAKHLNYYLNHGIPVIIVIVNDQTEKSYWCLCDADKTEKAGENWKITIPFNQELNTNSKNQLIKHTSPVIDYVSQLEHFWNTNKILKEHDRIIFTIDRTDIEHNIYHALVESFKRLQVNPDLLLASQGKVDICILGYDEDVRELHEIPEVKNWVNHIFGKIDGWVYFLVIDDNSQFLRVMQLCNIRHEQIKNYNEGNPTKKSYIMDNESAVQFLVGLYADLNEFTDKNNIPKEINKKVSSRLSSNFYPTL